MQEKASQTKSHFRLSILKSCFRIFGYAFLISGYLGISGIILVIAEIIGILEEL